MPLFIRVHCIFALTLAAVAGTPVEEWKREIEQSSGARIVLVKVFADPRSQEIKAPLNVDPFGIMRRYLEDPSFREQLFAAHALTINHDGPEGKIHFIVVNLTYADHWKGGGEQGLLAHEMGHVWLHAKGLRAPAFEPGERACLAIHSGDIVQHVLIREEMRRRGIDGSGYWLRQLETLRRSVESGEARRELPPCQRLTTLTQFIDARLGLTSEEWADFDRFQKQLEEHYTWLSAPARAIEHRLRSRDLADPEQFSSAVAFVRGELEKVFAPPLPSRPTPSEPQGG